MGRLTVVSSSSSSIHAALPRSRNRGTDQIAPRGRIAHSAPLRQEGGGGARFRRDLENRGGKGREEEPRRWFRKGEGKKRRGIPRGGWQRRRTAGMDSGWGSDGWCVEGRTGGGGGAHRPRPNANGGMGFSSTQRLTCERARDGLTSAKKR